MGAERTETHVPQSGGVSRRGFLAGAGIGAAGVVALSPADALAAVVNERFGADTAPGSNFGRIFRLPPFAEATPRIREALLELGKAGGLLDAKDDLSKGPILLITDPELSRNNPDNQTHTAGTTFLGQFLDHDMTFDQTSRLGVPTEPTRSPNTRTPAFDLDSVYGDGPLVDTQFYDSRDRAKFRLESSGTFEDLPRRSNGTAIISDPRNDENLMIAGLHSALMLFHNRIVDRLRSQGQTSNVFAQARLLTTWHYQWIIVHEFLPQIVGQQMVDTVLRNGRRFYRPSDGAFIPVEFQIAYRFGHTMVRPSYRANLAGDKDAQGNPAPFFGMIFDPAGEGQRDPVDLRGGFRAARRFIGWQTFFDFGGDQTTNVRRNKIIDTRISTPLFHLPLAAIPSGDQPISLPQRNLLRHLTWSLPSGQRIATTMGGLVLDATSFPELASLGVGFESSTPLWYYVLREAAVANNGTRLGPIGGRLVTEVFIGLLQLDRSSYLSNIPNWRPTLPSRTAGDFRMVDLLTFAKVDPASRGQ